MTYGSEAVQEFLRAEVDHGTFDEDMPSYTFTSRWRRNLTQAIKALSVIEMKDEFGVRAIPEIHHERLTGPSDAYPPELLAAVDTIGFAVFRIRRCGECDGLMLEPSDYGVCRDCEEEVARNE